MNRITWAATPILLALAPTGAFSQQVSCSSFESPVISDLGWTLVDEHQYEYEELGASVGYSAEHGVLTFYSYDLGIKNITDNVVEEQLFEAVRNAADAYRTHESQRELKSPKYLPEYVITGMISSSPYVLRGFSFESSLNGRRSMDIVTVGTDRNCIFKIWYTSALSGTPGSPVVSGMTELTKILQGFFIEFRKLNNG